MKDIEFEPFDEPAPKRIGTGSDIDDTSLERNSPKKRKSKSVLVVTLVFLISIIAIIFLYQYYQKSVVNKDKTSAELIEIRNALYLYKEGFGIYPNRLVELAKSRPLREVWLTDAWGNAYQYNLNENNTSFKLISAGYDGKLGTTDDIVVE